MNILCIGDSLGLPRDGVSLESTWFYRLCRAFPQYHFIDRFERGMLTGRLLESLDFSSWSNPDIVILQCGICDCAPRVINDKTFKWIMILRIAKRLGVDGFLWRCLKSIKGRKNRNCVYTPPSVFRKNVETYITNLLRSNIKGIVLVKIAVSSSFCQEKSPFIFENVNLYNKVLDSLETELVKVIDPLGICEDNSDCFLDDGYHLNEVGMNKVYQEIRNILTIYD